MTEQDIQRRIDAAVQPTVELVSDPCQLADGTRAQEVARLLAEARIEGAREERGRIIAAVEAERRRWLGKYGPYRDAHVDATLLLLDVLSDLPMAGVSTQESGPRRKNGGQMTEQDIQRRIDAAVQAERARIIACITEARGGER